MSKPLYLHLLAIAPNSAFRVSEPFSIAAIASPDGEYISAPGSFTTAEPNLFVPGGLLGLDYSFRLCSTVLPVTPVGAPSGFILLATENLLPPNVTWLPLIPVVSSVRVERMQIMDLGGGAGDQPYWFVGVDFTDGSSVNYIQEYNPTIAYYSPVAGSTTAADMLANGYRVL